MKMRILITLIAATLLFSSSALALNVESTTPNIGPTGTFNLYGARTLEKWQYAFGLQNSFMQDPLEFRNFTTGNQIRELVYYMYTLNVLAEVGVHKRVSVGVNVPLHYDKNLMLPALTQKDTYFGLGDINVYGKIAILHPDDFPVGFSVMPFITAPSGSSKHFMGDKSVDGGVRLIFDKEFSGGYINTNFGYNFHAKKDVITATGSTALLEVDDTFFYGVGGGVDIIKDRLQLLAEVRGSTVIKDFGQKENNSPIEADGGFRIALLDKHMHVNVGAGAGLNGGYGAPKYRVFGGLDVTFPLKEKKVAAAPISIILNGVNFHTGSAALTPDAKRVLDNNIAMLQKDPSANFVVVGHTDNRGADMANLKLSENRARSVRSYFVSRGIAPDRISSEGMGEAEPIVPNTSPENMEINRRVELKLIGSRNSM